MTNKFKRAIAGVMAVATMTVSSIGMSASAYAPTVTKTFKVNNSTITCVLTRNDSSAPGSISATSASSVSLTVRWGGHSAYKSGTTYAYTYVSGSYTGTASSSNTAVVSGVTGSCSITGA